MPPDSRRFTQARNAASLLLGGTVVAGGSDGAGFGAVVAGDCAGGVSFAFTVAGVAALGLVVVAGAAVVVGLGLLVEVDATLGTVDEGMKGFTVVEVEGRRVVVVEGLRAAVVVGAVDVVSIAVARTGSVRGDSVAASIESVRGWNVSTPRNTMAKANMAREARGRLRLGVGMGFLSRRENPLACDGIATPATQP